MKLNNGFGRKLRHGSVSAALTAGVIAAVILLNVLVSALCSANLWFIDMTTGHYDKNKKAEYEGLYTLSSQAKKLLGDTIASANAARAEDDPVKVDIIFCADPDMLCGNRLMRYIYYTALSMQKEFSDTIEVSTVDVWDNPSAVDAYRTNAYSSIYQSNIIVASGTEFRVYSYRTFYTYNDSADEEPWAYSGEKNFIKGITAVTRAEAPICALTVGHGEPFQYNENNEIETEYTEFLNVIKNAGYDIVLLNLGERDIPNRECYAEKIPENCRLVLTFDPQTDFVSNFLSGGVSEMKRLEQHLSNAYSYMIFVDADTPKLPNLEEFLEEWGITFERYDDTATYEIIDADSSVDGVGQTIIGQYESEAMGGSLTSDMREKGANPKVVFGNALSIGYSSTYETIHAVADEEQGTGAYTYGYYFRNSRSRGIYDVFRASETAFAYAKENGTRLTDESGADLVVDSANKLRPFRLMTITSHSRTVGEGKGYTSVQDNSYVCAVGSTQFASNEILGSNSYGNTDALLGTLRVIGKEIVPVGFDPVPFHEVEMGTDYYSESFSATATVLLTVLPVAILAGVGIYVLVRRKVRS